MKTCECQKLNIRNVEEIPQQERMSGGVTFVRPSPMQVDASIPKMQILIDETLQLTNHKKYVDAARGDCLHILTDFVDWEPSGPTFTFNKLKDDLRGAITLCFNEARLYRHSLSYSCTESKKERTTRKFNEKVSIFL